MQNFIESLLKMSVVSNDQIEVQEVDIESVIKKEVANIINDNEKRIIDVEFNTCTRCIYADAMMMKHVIQNLLSNAIKYSKPEEVIKIDISIEKFDKDKSWLFSIKDNSIGINQYMIWKVFAPLKKENSESKGAGIGLSIVKKIIEKHNGKICVVSEKDKYSILNLQSHINISLLVVLE